GLFHPLLVRSIFDQVVVKHDFKHFVFLIIIYLTFGVFITITTTATALWSKSLENQIVQNLSGRLLTSFYQQEYASILTNGYGYYISRISGDIRDGLVPLLSLIQTIINQAVLLAALSFVLVYLSWKAFLFLAAIIPVASVAGALLGKRIKKLTAKEREQEGSVLATLAKALSAFRMVKNFQLLGKTVHLFDNKLGDYLSTSYQRYRITRLFQGLNGLITVLCDFLSLFVGALFVLKGALTFGGYLAFVNAFWRAVGALTQLFKSVPDLHSFGAILTRIVSFLAFSSAAYYQSGPEPSIKDVGFSYGDRKILTELSLRLSPGEKVVIVGPNGSGKTTLANILSGHLAPYEGKVVLPERIRSITLPISFPPLKVKDLVTDAEVLSEVGLDGAALELWADELSAGQQQKLAISLVLSQEADLYIIDEPLANLDPDSRDKMIDLILKTTKEKTLVMIMHGAEEHHKRFDRVIRIGFASNAADNQFEQSLVIKPL
ncbi:MAG TPA: ABC transporter ATP-binding protein, partial [Candidatus Angelobacter sp.]|nr:ABC transporter ATP-binding protein [Candidatus Angelobacter sp.]